MPESHKYHAFISYSRRDFDEVNALLQKLQSEVPEFKYWFDLEGIESGDEFVRKIVSAIDQSERILFMLSDNSIDSKWAEQEVMYARNSGKRIIPILLKGAKLKGWFLFTFGNIDSIDTQDAHQMSKLIANLRQWCGAKPTKPETLTTIYPVQPQKETEIPKRINRNGKWGFENKKGEIIIPCIYDDAYCFSEGRAPVKNNGKWGFIDVNGYNVIPCIYGFACDFSEGRAAVIIKGKHGFIDMNGNNVIPCIYDSGWRFSEGYAPVEKDGKYGFIDVNGNNVIPYIYDLADNFSEGRAMVRKDGERFFIDKNGNKIT